jgi:hypothetical protein
VAPASFALTSSPDSAKEVMAMMGIFAVAASARIFRVASSPEIFGS